MTPLEQLRQAVELLPDGASVTFSREALLGAIGDVPLAPAESAPELLTVSEAGALLHRRPSTIREWCAAGLLEDAVKVRGRSWCIPRAAVLAFLDRERTGQPALSGRSRAGALSDWRRVRSKGDPA